MAKNTKEAVNDRRKKILQDVCMNYEVNIALLAKKYNASQMTIWRDLEYLQKYNYIQKTNIGSVKKSEDLSLDPDIYKRSKVATAQKVAIALKAIELIEDGDVLGLDSSTSVLELAKLLFIKNDITVISNNMLLMPVLYNHPSLQLVSTGGVLKMKGYSSEGSIAIETISQFSYDKVFVSANAIDAEFGLSNTEIFETGTKKAFIKNAKTKIVLADSTKFGKQAVQRWCTFHDIDILVTDCDKDSEQIKTIEEKGTKVICCNAESEREIS